MGYACGEASAEIGGGMTEIGDGGGMTGHGLVELTEKRCSDGFLLRSRAVEGDEIRLAGLNGIVCCCADGV